MAYTVVTHNQVYVKQGMGMAGLAATQAVRQGVGQSITCTTAWAEAWLCAQDLATFYRQQ